MLEWTFSPHDYFEEVIEIAGQGYTMTIADDGHANAKIDLLSTKRIQTYVKDCRMT